MMQTQWWHVFFFQTRTRWTITTYAVILFVVRGGNLLSISGHVMNRQCVYFFVLLPRDRNYHVIGISDLLELWVIKIKIPMILCARSNVDIKWTEQEMQITQREHAKGFYSIVKTRLHDYQTWPTHFWEIYGVRKGMWVFFLDCDFRVLIGWAAKLRSRGNDWALHWMGD